MCFDQNISKKILEDSEFVHKVKSISTLKADVKYKTLIKSSKQLIWILETSETQPSVTKSSESDGFGYLEISKNDEKIDNQTHIMISYNRESRELCKQVKLKLEEIGLKVWMDLSDMHGSTLEAMANAVENAESVLMCVTEKYRQSVNCQVEAKYAFKLKKKIVPLIMQDG